MMTMLSPSSVRRGAHDLLHYVIHNAASKCDDISCTEVILALDLGDDPELEEIEDHIHQYEKETKEWKKKKSEAMRSTKGLIHCHNSLCSWPHNILAIETELKGIRERLREFAKHLEALKNNKPFTSRLTAKATVTGGKKRKNSHRGKKGSPKKHRSSPNGDEDESIGSDFDSESDGDSDSNSDFASDKDSDDEQTDDESESSLDSEGSDSDEDEDETTEEDLTEKIKENKDAVKAGRNRLSKARKRRKDAVDYLSTLKKNIAKAQKEKNAFCSLKRSEV
jgi:hypothetical protein